MSNEVPNPTPSLAAEPALAAAPTPVPAPAAAPPPPPPAAKPRKRWGCFFKLFVLLLVFLVLAGGLLVAVQWALQNTDYARNIALPIVEQQLGLRLHAKGLKVSLFGHTELTDVDVGLPLDDQDFLHVPAIKVRHANLLQIILDRAVTLDDVEIDRPTVDVVQDHNGQWNLLRVVDILGRLGGSNNAQPTATSGGVPKLPAVRLVNGTINVDDGHGHHAQVAPLNVTGKPDHLLKWTYDLAAGPAGAELLAVQGVVAPGGDWQHRLTVTIAHLDPLAKAFGVPDTYAASVLATWDGALVDGKVGGRLTLRNVSAVGVPSLGVVGVTGAIDVATGGGNAPAGSVPASAAAAASPTPLVTLSPSNLQLVTGNRTVPTVGVTAGAITYDAGGLHARGLKVNALGGAASLEASADPKTQNVDLSAHWSGLTLAAGISQAGSLTASVRQPFPGQPVIRVELDDQGSLGGNPAALAPGAKAGTRWDATVQVTGQGSTWTSVDWLLAVPRFKVMSGGTTYDLSGLTAQVQQRPTTIDLLGLTLPPAVAPPSPSSGSAAAAVATTLGGGSRSATAVPAPRSSLAATTAGGSPYGLSFSSSAHVTLPDKSAGRAMSWTANLSAGLTANYQGTPVPVTVSLDAVGDDTLYTLRQFAVTAADADLTVDGEYDRSNPKPVALHVRLSQTPRLTPDAPIQGTFGGDFKVVGLLFDDDPAASPANAAAAQVALSSPGTTEPSTAPSAGPSTVPVVPVATTAPTTGPADVRPKAFRPYLTTTGDLRANELVLFGKPIGDIDVQLAGDVRTPPGRKTVNGPASADAPPPPPSVRVELHSTDFALFQSPWNLTVEYPNADGVAEVNLSTAHLPLDVLAKAATGQSTSPIAGQIASAHWRVTAAGLGLGQVDLASEYHLTDLNAGGLTVDTVDASASFHDGIFKLDPVVARSGTGVTHISATYALAQPTHVRTSVSVNQWPYALGTALGGTTEARANAKVDLDVDLANKGANGTATAALDVLLHPTLAGQSLPQTLAHAQLAATVRGQSIDLTDLSGRVLNGTFTGTAQADLGKPLEAAGRIAWRDVDAGALGPITGNKALADLHGKFSGTVTIAPSRDPRSLEPVRVDLNVTATHDARFRSVVLGDPYRLLMTHAVVYLNTDRAVIDHSDMYLGGGVVHLWGRVGRNLASSTTIIDLVGLSLDQLTHVVPAQVDGTVPGTLSGTYQVIRSGPGLAAITGGGHFDLANADLDHVKALGSLYGLMGRSGGGPQPVGYGSIELANEVGTVRITSLKFFNRGIEADGLLTAGPFDTDDIESTPLSGQVAGAVRDLKGTRLPFLSDFDEAFTALEKSLVTLNISGTVGKPDIHQATADDIGNQLRELLVGNAQKESK